MGTVTVIFDGGCSICRRFQRFTALFDRRDVLDWQRFDEVDYDTVPVSEKDCLAAMQVIDDGEVYAGYDAVRRICRVLPPLLPLYVLFSLPGIHWAGHRVYRWVADHRHCAVPFTD